MNKIGSIFIMCLLLLACAKEGSDPLSPLNSKEKDEQLEKQVIYGDDNRIENYQASESLKSLAASTVALVQASSLVRNSSTGKYDLLGSQFGDKHQLCSSEPFREQTIGAFCSGSLVGPDTVLTAGHCITNATDCSNVRFVFDFAVKAPGVEKKSFASSEVYACREIIRRTQVDTGADFALIRLDRAVTGKAPLAYRRTGTVSNGDSLFVIGHPSGIPQKIAGGAQVRSVQSQYFTANLDTFAGNSGSAVFSATSKEIEGVLVRGDTDFVWSGSCSISYRCASGACRGEEVTRMDQIARYIPVSTPARSVASAEPNVAIPDYPQAGVTSSVAVTSAPAGRKVQVQLEITHSYRGDLKVELMAPSGKSVVLLNREGGSLDNVIGTYDIALSSETRAGVWTLKVSDLEALDVGVLKQWSLIFSN